MSKAIDNLQAAQKRAMEVRPRSALSSFPARPLASRATDVPAFDFDVDFAARNVAYYGCDGEAYIENYRVVEI
jgi:uncharacterized protein YbcV (DUF1398 family)